MLDLILAHVQATPTMPPASLPFTPSNTINTD
jgi:hypothetical protein